MPLTIPLPVDDDTAEAFAAASPERQREWLTLAAIRLRRLTRPPTLPFPAFLDEIGRRAAERGLTEAELNDILADADHARGD